MKITLSNYLEITEAENFEIDATIKFCTHPNPKYFEAQKQGYSTRKIDRQICLYQQTDDGLTIPTGLLDDLLGNNHALEVIDHRNNKPVAIPFTGKLRPYQEQFVNEAILHEGGVMVAATGAGKTVSAIALAARLKQRALILVKSKDLAEQWLMAIKQFTGLSAGLIGGGKDIEGNEFTVGLVQSLVKRDLSRLDYGLVIADECHNAPASQFYNVINNINSRYKYGLSATPQRRDSLEFMIHAALGGFCAEIKANQLDGKVLPVLVNFVHYEFEESVESWNEFIGVLVNDDWRNAAIVKIATQQTKPTIILCSQVKHCEILTTLANEAGLKPLLIYGQLPVKTRSERMEMAKKANLIIGTAQLLGEGIDLPHLEVLILASPMSAVIAGKQTPAATQLMQSIGRCRRPYLGKSHAIVIDIVDGCGFGLSAYHKRSQIYHLQGFKVAA